MRVKIVLSYNGSSYLGLQNQKESDNTILDTLYKVFKRLKVEGKIVASGRTDKGVHATRQVIHIDLPPFWSDAKKLHRVLNMQLPSTIYVRHVMKVDDEFHARYSAKRRSYRYIISNKTPNPFEQELITFTDIKLDIEKINSAMKHFEGRHNFEMFKKNGSETSHYVREIFKAFAYEHNKNIILYFEANGYLRSQIRLMVGFLLKICEDKLGEDELREQLECKKQHNSKLAPPSGLYLCNVIY